MKQIRGLRVLDMEEANLMVLIPALIILWILLVVLMLRLRAKPPSISHSPRTSPERHVVPPPGPVQSSIAARGEGRTRHEGQPSPFVL